MRNQQQGAAESLDRAVALDLSTSGGGDERRYPAWRGRPLFHSGINQHPAADPPRQGQGRQRTEAPQHPRAAGD